MTADAVLAYNPNDVGPGWGALVLVLALVAVTYLLWRSMNTQLRRIKMPPSRPPDTRIPGATSDSAAEAQNATEADAEGDDRPPRAGEA
jgi:hypothetical protein